MTSRRTQQRLSVTRIAGFAAWVVIVGLFLFWQAAKYEGIMSLIGEWQFNAFGRHYATLNYVLLVLLLCLPGYLIFLRPRALAEDDRPDALLFRSARTFLRAVIGAVIGMGAIALLILVMMLLLPSERGPVQHIDLTRPALTEPHEGPTELSGTVLYERTAGFDEDMLVARRTFRFAPVVGARQGGNELRYFVQFAPADARTNAGAMTMTGVLKRNGLPGEIVRLFRYAGYQVDQPHYVLFAEPAAMRWPYITTAVQLVIGALLALALGLFQRRRVRRIDRQVHGEPVST
ncbi:hypothetical protein [Sphingomonas sp.]|uniref:hypothetical protein n=1 Tax=Sphingomonas sp. TaxID=28214 RepID=UPI003CC58638